VQAYLAIDAGGTNTRVGLVSGGKVIKSLSFTTLPACGPEDWLKRLKLATQNLLEQFKDQEITLKAVGLGMPGAPAKDGCSFSNCANLPSFAGRNWGKALTEIFNLPAAVENDANLYTLGEFTHGAGKEVDSMACLTLGTGVGGGIIMQKSLLKGPLGLAGEIGHIVVEPNGRRCACGCRGCLEAYASKVGLTGMLREGLAKGRHTALKPGDSVELITQAAGLGDSLARDLLKMAGMALGRAVSILVSTLGLDFFVLGGGLSKAWPLMEQETKTELARRMRLVEISGIRLIQAEQGEQAPLLGAGALAAGLLNK
jgi:glucokinase